MCQKCVDAIKIYWPNLKDENGNYGRLLMNCTAFPFAKPENIELQLKEMAEKSGHDLDLACAIADEETEKAM